MAGDLERRVERLEEKPQGRDIEITIQHKRTEFSESGERIRIPVPASGYDEGEWSDAGNGNRLRVRTPRYDADHGIVRDKEVTGD